MRANGWQGDPVDVVRMPDNMLTSVDNKRILAAKMAGIDVQANVYAFDEGLPGEIAFRFPGPKGQVPTT